MQVRYNRLLETNPLLQCAQCDRSWGDNGGFFIQLMRLIYSTLNVYRQSKSTVYLQCVAF